MSAGLVFVSATAATDATGAVVAKGDMYGQAKVILEKIGAVLEQAGSSLATVVQTRLYVTNIDQWAEAGRAHGEIFGSSGPAMSLVQVKPFLDPDMLIEIELIAAVVG